MIRRRHPMRGNRIEPAVLNRSKLGLEPLTVLVATSHARHCDTRDYR
jgi:hypothetical protein